eukprot:CAMPEP_0183329992 /NCGR_PEP_ID=MMETSP0160_2-20130417/85076_1 /TAXON_ID=2839 ORGANISM="Odontella Sinensis, Strain Grunow 1884" /NCGR_SAMPLE_ID=MMETSP0160_2 /ASSEMBLY_ACC=CAM_ASM_000250 /LENGTH=53 /DNA_ID=CAMNT_0025498191 /DNA_START=21 /DNA_END=185 /DNA_ORIENTATION=+
MKPDGAAGRAMVMAGRAMALMALPIARWFAVNDASGLAMAMVLPVTGALPVML